MQIPSYKPIYEAHFLGYGTVRWVNELPEQVETEQGLIDREALMKMAGTRYWERTEYGFRLSEKHS